MLPKKLFIAAKAATIKYLKQFQGETAGKSGLASVPVEVGRGIEDVLRYVAGQERVSLGGYKGQETKTKEFLAEMQKANLIVPHPWGGWMVLQSQATPSVDEAEELVLEAMSKI